MESIQLILVDDGSVDNSLSICKKVERMFPQNVKIIVKENGGVAQARNIAIPYIEGEYVEFLDSDDILSKNTLKDVYNFFNEHNEEIDLVAIPVYYFEGREGEHYLNSKFHSGQSIVDLNETPQNVLIYVTSVFLKSKIVKKYRFDESLSTCEDAKYLIQILLEKEKYGLISSCRYNYRMRTNEKSSLSQTAKKNINWYEKQLNNYPMWIANYCLHLKGYIPQFVKYTIAMHLQWRFKKNIENIDILSDDDNKRYKIALKESVSLIDDEIIDQLTEISDERKIFMKNYKKNQIIEKER